VSQGVVKCVNDAFFGVVETDTGAIRAERGNYLRGSHASKGMTVIHGDLWRYRDSDKRVLWWERPSREEDEAVKDWLVRHGYAVKRGFWLTQNTDARKT
jgi:hypothetical protein